MEDSARLYNCACCHQLVVLCRDCDRGNIYCFNGCAEKQRIKSARQANKRYRESFNGRRNAAQRQAELRKRRLQVSTAPPPQEEKVTHYGYEVSGYTVSMDLDSRVACGGENRCHCCGSSVGFYLRLSFIRHQHDITLDLPHFQRN